MADPKPEGLTITFQGKDCAPMFRYASSVGLEPGRGEVFMERADFVDFVVHEIVPPSPSAPVSLQTVERVPPSGTGLQVAGDLLFRETIDGVDYDVAWKNVILTEKAIEVSLASDDGSNEICRLEITDPRYGWGTRGIFFGWFNVPTPIDPANTSAPGTQSGAGQDSIDAVALGQKIQNLSRSLKGYESTLAGLQNQKTNLEQQKATATALNQKADAAAAATALKTVTADIARFKSLDAIAKAQLSALEQGGAIQGVQAPNLSPAQQQQAEDANRQLIQAQADIDSSLQEKAILTQQVTQLTAQQASEQATIGAVTPGGVPLVPGLAKALVDIGVGSGVVDPRATGLAIFQAKAALQSVNSNLAKQRASLDDANAKLDALGAPVPVQGQITKVGAVFGNGNAAQSPSGTVSPGGQLIASSLDPDTNLPWTVKTFLVKRVLPALWFAPKLKYIADDVGAKQISAKVYDPPVLPKKAFHDVLEEFQLLVAWNLQDATVSVWKKGEGELTDSDAQGSKIAFRGDDVNLDPRVCNARRLTSFAHVPAVVAVVGAPIIAAARTRLEAVGVHNGQIVPLDQALAGIGLTRAQACSLVLLPTERRGALYGMSQEGLREFERWAFKWYGFPGGASANSEKLPILDARAALGKAGEFLPLRVYSECHVVISTLEAALAAIQVAAAKAPSSVAQTFTEDALNQIRADGAGSLRAVVNVAFSEQASGWRVDKERGLVMFESPQGNVVRPGRSLNEARLLDRDPTVELEFAFQRRPSLDVPISLAQRYNSVWTRDTNGNAQPLPVVPEGTAPVTIYRPDLQQIDGLDGKTNKALLDILAKALAQAQFAPPVSVEGAIVELGRPVQVQLNGSVLSCEWSSSIRGWVTTTAHIKAFAPLAPVPKLQTRAFGDLRFDNLVRDSVFAPKGLS